MIHKKGKLGNDLFSLEISGFIAIYLHLGLCNRTAMLSLKSILANPFYPLCTKFSKEKIVKYDSHVLGTFLINMMTSNDEFSQKISNSSILPLS